MPINMIPDPVKPLIHSLLGAAINSATTSAIFSNQTIANGSAAMINATLAPISTPKIASPNVIDVSLHRANFVWPEDPDEDLPVNFPRFYNRYNDNRRLHMSALVPFGVMLVLSTIIFIMIIFRRWPGLVSGIIAGSLTFISIYLLLLTLKEEVLVYE